MLGIFHSPQRQGPPLRSETKALTPGNCQENISVLTLTL